MPSQTPSNGSPVKRWYPDLSSQEDYGTRDGIQRAYTTIYTIQDQLNSLLATNPIGASWLQQSLANETLASAIRPSLECTGANPLNLQNLVGRTQTGQYTFVPQYERIPTLLDGVANVGDGTLLTLTGPSRPIIPQSRRGFKTNPFLIGTTPDGLLLRFNDQTHTFNPVEALGTSLVGLYADMPNADNSSIGAMWMPLDRPRTAYICFYNSALGHNFWYYWLGIWAAPSISRPLTLPVTDSGLWFFETDTQNLLWWDATLSAWRVVSGPAALSPWTAYTPTVGMQGGTLTTTSLTARFSQTGNTCSFRIHLVGSFTGTPGRIDFSLPTSRVTPDQAAYGTYADDAGFKAFPGALLIVSGGPGGSAILQGWMNPPATTTFTMNLQGTYEC